MSENGSQVPEASNQPADPRAARQERYVAQTTEQFAALGRFVQSLEQMLYAARFGCMQLFRPGNGAQQRLLQMFLGHQSMTANPVFDLYRSLLAEIVGDLG